MRFHKAFIWPHFVLFPLPKVACSSVQSAVQESQARGVAHEGYSLKMVGNITDEDVCGKKCYTMVRNPYDRLVSLYMNKIVKGKEMDKEHPLEYYNLHVGMNFGDMVRAICDIPDEEADRHFKQQSALLSPNGKMLATHSWHFDQIGDFWKAVQKEVDVPDLAHKNRSDNRKAYKKHYTLETRRLVEERYKDDLEIFRFDFG